MSASQLPLGHLLELIASAENASEHALGKAIVDFSKRVMTKETFSKCINYQAVPGCGLKAKIICKLEENAAVENSAEKSNSFRTRFAFIY